MFERGFARGAGRRASTSMREEKVPLTLSTEGPESWSAAEAARGAIIVRESWVLRAFRGPAEATSTAA